MLVLLAQKSSQINEQQQKLDSLVNYIQV